MRANIILGVLFAGGAGIALDGVAGGLMAMATAAIAIRMLISLARWLGEVFEAVSELDARDWIAAFAMFLYLAIVLLFCALISGAI